MKKPPRSAFSKYLITFSIAWLFVVFLSYVYIDDFQAAVGALVDNVVQDIFGSEE
jgi:hypothetical protein